MSLLKCLVLIIVVLALVVGRALPDRGGEAVSTTRAFAIDGRKFLVEDPVDDTFSLIEQELAKRGIDTLPISKDFISALDFRTAERLREEPGDVRAPALPRGLEPDHVLRLETETGPVEIAFGRVVSDVDDVLGRLRSSGWECRVWDPHGAPGAIAHLAKRREASFVFMEKDERHFLALRRVAR